MPRRLTLHVGTPKSGTTYLQSLLARGRRELARDGVLYPGAKRLPRRGFNQQPAIYAAAGASTGWADDDVRRTSEVYLRHLCEELSAHPGRALVSAESLAFFDVDAARGLLRTLGYDPAGVTVVITARDLGRILPSIWQQNVKNGSTQALGPYLDSVASLRDGPRSPVWTAFGLPGLVDRWAEVIGDVGRVVLVTSPATAAPTDELWNRFAAAADVRRELATLPGPRPLAVDNVSLTLAQAELVRGLNGVLQADGYSRDHQQRLRGHLLDIWMNLPGASGSRRPAVPAHLHDTVRAWARDDIARLAASGARVEGELGDLEPRLRDDAGSATAIDEETVRDVLALLEHGRGLASAARGARGLPSIARPLLRWRAAIARVRRPEVPGPRQQAPAEIRQPAEIRLPADAGDARSVDLTAMDGTMTGVSPSDVTGTDVPAAEKITSL